MKNHWLYRKGQKQVIQEINRILCKFVGWSISPIDKLFIDMRNEIINYFKKDKDKLKFFTDDMNSFDYNFEVDEKNGFVTAVIFTVDD